MLQGVHMLCDLRSCLEINRILLLEIQLLPHFILQCFVSSVVSVLINNISDCRRLNCSVYTYYKTHIWHIFDMCKHWKTYKRAHLITNAHMHAHILTVSKRGDGAMQVDAGRHALDAFSCLRSPPLISFGICCPERQGVGWLLLFL